MLQVRFDYIISMLGLKTCGFTLGSLRAGGATAHFLVHHNIGTLMFRRRWASVKTLGHYIQIALASQAYAAIPMAQRQLVEALSDLAEFVLTPECLA